jgi:glycosyltransferase involved in cell wall biosynthesis
MANPPKLLFLVTEDWYFCSHRLPLAVAARQAGYEVIVATRVNRHGPAIEAAGLRLVPLQRMQRSSLNPFRELHAVAELVAVYRRERPSLAHHVALKPVVYGTIAARITGVHAIVNAVAGLGFVFSSRRALARALRPLLVLFFRLLLANPGERMIVQNSDDEGTLIDKGLADPAHVRRIPGSGVDLLKFEARPLDDGVPLVVLASRMLWDKGVGEFVDAARRLRKRNLAARFVLAGDTDSESPAGIPRNQLAAWQEEGVVEWWGHREDMPEVLLRARVVCLPSFYGEGIPKVLIEAMACARPIVTTDMPGCRELVREGENGLLVPPRDAESLARALGTLVSDPELCGRMGGRGREIAAAEFSIERVVDSTLAVYRELVHP